MIELFPYVHVIVSFFSAEKIGSSVVKLHVKNFNQTVRRFEMLIWSTVSPFVITEILPKWILTTFQDEQKTISVLFVCCCCFFWCLCVTKIVPILIIYTRCIMRLIRYNILLQFLCTIFSILCWWFYTISYTKMGNFYWVFGVPYKKLRKHLIVPILAACFSQRESMKIAKNQLVQKFYDNNFLPVYH